MQEKLIEDLSKVLEKEPPEMERKFKCIFLLDDFSASGTSYLKYDSVKNKLKGKINALYQNIFDPQNVSLQGIFNLDELEIHVVLYLCTNQAKCQIEGDFDKLNERYSNRPFLHCMHLIPESFKLDQARDKEVIELCVNPSYYDKNFLEDEHTGENIQLGFQGCALPLVLSHNCPNNSVPILWAYDEAFFEGLFPRIPRHREI
jgi:hypothetical protein